jgi:hypothetical protein
LLRYCITLVVALAACDVALFGAPPVDEPPQSHEYFLAPSQTWPEDAPLPAGTPPGGKHEPATLDGFGFSPGIAPEPARPSDGYLPILGWLGLRHSHTHGRHIGRGDPLAGTSWTNRPFYVGGELGTLWLTRSIHENVSRDVDAFGGIIVGWDRDTYWGAELRFNWATPELVNSVASDAARTDSLFAWNYSFMYYPWGDAAWRPYWRTGIGNTHFDFPLDDGTRHDQWMLTFPLGFGVKYPINRWLAARVEVTDHLSIGRSLPTQHNPTFTLGVEWRFGARPRSYWPWHPGRHVW